MPLLGVLAALGRHPVFQSQLTPILDRLAGAADPSFRGSGQTPQITLCPGARAAWVAALWAAVPAPVLVLTPRSEDARRLHDQLLTYLGETAPVYLLPEPEVLPFERLAVDSRTVSLRLTALAALARGRSPGSEGERTPLVVASVGAALRLTLPPGVMAHRDPARSDAGPAVTALAAGQRVPRLDALLGGWVRLGYRSVPVVEAPGSFAQRGGIIDLFPAQADLPVRIELWDDQVESIRAFDPATQRSIGDLAGGDLAGDGAGAAAQARLIRLIPAREQLPHLGDASTITQQAARLDFARCHPDVRARMEEELAALLEAPNLETLSLYNGLLNRHTVLDYLPPASLVVLDRPGLVQTEAQDQEEKYLRMRLNREERGELPVRFPAPYLTWEQALPDLKKLPQLHLQGFMSPSLAAEARLDLSQGSRLSEGEEPFGGPEEAPQGNGSAVFHPAPLYYGRLDQLAADLREGRGRNRAVVVVSHHAPGRVAEILEQAGVPAAAVDGVDQLPQPGQVCLVAGSLREGWDLDVQGASLILLTDAELFGTVKERPTPSGQSGPESRRRRIGLHHCPGGSGARQLRGAH